MLQRSKSIGFLGALAASVALLSQASAQPEILPELSAAILKNYAKADANGDGKIEGRELKGVLKRMMSKFPKADANGDGVLSLDEQKTIVEKMSTHKKKAAPQKKHSAPSLVPQVANYAYGEHERQIFDLWQAKSDEKAPLAIYIHGGGFKSGSKEKLKEEQLEALLEAGISVASINYRYLTTHPLPTAHEDACRALQTLRAHADQWNLDKEKVAVFGGSAGAQIAMWLGFKDEMADPDSKDRIARESSRVTCVATSGGQTDSSHAYIKMMMESYGLEFDPKEHIPHYKEPSDVEKANATAIARSAYHLISSDDPPIFQKYGMDLEQAAPPKTSPEFRGFVVHHVSYGIHLKEKADQLGVENHLNYPGQVTKYKSITDFITAKLKE